VLREAFIKKQALRKFSETAKGWYCYMLSNYILLFWLSTNTYYFSLHLKLCYLNWKWVES